jgi:hypothetical protein
MLIPRTQDWTESEELVPWDTSFGAASLHAGAHHRARISDLASGRSSQNLQRKIPVPKNSDANHRRESRSFGNGLGVNDARTK